MSDDHDNNPLKWLLAAGAGIGMVALLNKFLSEHPKMSEAEALKILQRRKFNPLSVEDLEEQKKALAALQEIRIRRENAAMEKAGYPIDREMEVATIEMIRQNHTLSDDWSSCKKLLNASSRLIQRAQQTAEELGGSNSPHGQHCSYCGGIGWYVCRGCHGTGRDRAVPYPDLTGDRRFDALILDRYDRASICPGCQGRENMVCHRCGGTGRSR